jgi:predicted ATPase/class 3 adenylate cyclase
VTAQGGRTLTFLFSDVEGSTRLLAALGDRYAEVLLRQREILAGACERHSGRVFGSEGDALFVVFAEPVSALLAAAEAQVGLDAADWPEGWPIRVRMGIHTGSAQPIGDDFVGLALHETARITAAGHGGQVLVSASTHALAQEALPPGSALRAAGEHRLKDLPAPIRLYQLDVPGRVRDFPPLRTLDAVGARLPVQVTTFVGREHVARGIDLLERTRLLTLTGPGGTGKTRLSLSIASEVAARFPDGTWFVPLDAVMDPGLVASEIASALGLQASAEPPIDRVVGHLSERRALLVLDNLEQVVEAGPDVARILRECAQVAIVATSRVPLRVYGEQELPVPPLTLPARETDRADEAARSEAVQLFVERAMAARPDFELSDANASAVSEIVRQLDGLPLAIELAAARLRVLPLESLRDRLTHRLGLLVGGARDRPTRQQTLRGAIDWSYELLDGPGRRLFADFSVFAGGADLEQADVVCGPRLGDGVDVFEGLSSLAEQSLVRPEEPVSGAPRFGMLMTIREYAGERLAAEGEADAVHRRHAEACLALAERCAPLLTGADAGASNDRLEAEHDNLRAALDWVVAADEAGLGLRLVGALWRFWQARGHLIEGDARAHAVLALPSVATQPPEVRAVAEGAAGSIAYWRGDKRSSNRHYTAALGLAEESGDRSLIARASYDAGFAAAPALETQRERYLAGAPHFERALELFRELGDRRGVADALWALAMSLGARGDVDGLERLARESLALGREMHDPFRIGWSAHLLGLVLMHLGNADEARPHLTDALEVFRSSGDLGGVSLLLADFALLARLEGDPVRGWRLMGAADRLRERSGTDLLLEGADFVGWDWPKAPETDEERAAFEAGRTSPLDDAIARALARG